MSQLSVTTIKSLTASTPPVIQDSAGTQIGTFCRAWVNFNGTGTVAIRAAFNCSSVTDNGTGSYTANLATSMSDANYCCNVNASTTIDATNTNPAAGVDRTTSSVRIDVEASGGAQFDADLIDVAIFR